MHIKSPILCSQTTCDKLSRYLQHHTINHAHHVFNRKMAFESLLIFIIYSDIDRDENDRSSSMEEVPTGM